MLTWTFFGSVGLSATTGFDFIPVYLGPIIMFAVGWPLIRRVIRLSKAQNITSIADFIAARYGKSQLLGGLVVKIGSQMIDGSIRTKLNSLATAMKG